MIALKIKTILIGLLVLFSLANCEHDNMIEPVASIQISPMLGDTITVFSLNGEMSRNKDNVPFGLTYYWTIDDSIQLESDSTLNRTAYQFKSFGEHSIKLSVKNIWGLEDTATASVLVKEYSKDSFYIDARDGRKYRTVLINDVWWFAENLKYGVSLQQFEEPSNNGIVEKYVRNSDLINQDGYYLPQEAHKYSLDPDSSICPPGWSLPDFDSEESLVNDFFMSGGRDFYLPGGITGLDFEYSGYFNADDDSFHDSDAIYWWGKEVSDSKLQMDKYSMLVVTLDPSCVLWFVYANYSNLTILPDYETFQQKEYALPIRCIRRIR